MLSREIIAQNYRVTITGRNSERDALFLVAGKQMMLESYCSSTVPA
jgi:hypothetical protein